MKNKKIVTFNTFLRKEYLHIFRDVWTTLILLLLPVLVTFLIGFGISTEVKNVNVAVFDASQDVATQGIIQKLSAGEYFTVTHYVHSEAEIEYLFKRNKIGMAIVFGGHFHENMLHASRAEVLLLTDASDPNTAATANTYSSMLIASYLNDLNQKSGTTMPYQIQPEITLLYNPTMDGSFSTVPGVLGLVLTLICAMMTSVSIVKEKESGTMEILLVSPLKPITIILAKTIPYFSVSMINLATVLTLSVFVLGVPITGNFFLLIMICLLYIFVSLAFGILISTIVSSQLVAMLVSGLLLLMPVMMLSGLVFPVENMPLALKWFSHVIPAKWFILAVKSVMIKGAGFRAVMMEFGILLAMAVCMIVVSIKKFKNRL
ncbi:MAG: ABC transporter permease [Bacteroidales bacterium]|jgi:ABC-2 type transport system permease protein|nr:ABC transporter permease [Bacteroidales bacterium]